MLRKYCSKCYTKKSISDFGLNKSKKDGFATECRECHNAKQVEYNRSEAGRITQIYGTMKYNSKDRHHPPPSFTKDELTVWLYEQGYEKLFDDWVASNYDVRVSPSCDRTDDYQGYCLSRLVLVTWEENNKSNHADRVSGKNRKELKPVKQLTLAGELIAEFFSGAEASRKTGACAVGISYCCCGKRKTSYGFKWEFAGRVASF